MSEPKGTMNNIGWAVKQLQNGSHVRRSGWNGKGMYLMLAREREVEFGSKKVMLAAHVNMFTVQGYLIPWLCSQSDLLATDWELAD